MTSTEIEDILSSIRRLVSEEDRPALRGSASKGEKLVLTPALRIVPPSPDEPLALTDPILVSAPEPSTHGPQDAAEAAAVEVDGDSADALADGPAPAVAFPPMPDDAPPASDGLVPQPALAPPTHHAAAAVEAALSRQPGDWEPDGGEATDPTPWAAEWAALPELDEPQPKSDEPAAAPPVDLLDQAPDFDRVWEDFLAETKPDPAPSLRAFADGEEDNLTWHEAAIDTPADREHSAIDEEMLRDIVRDVLREELQGALGERITRNVRKLVRAEIYRAMTARDLG